MAKIDLPGGGGNEDAAAVVDEILLRGVGEVEGVLSLKIEHDESTGEIRILNEDGTPFDSSQISHSSDTNSPPPTHAQPPVDLYTQKQPLANYDADDDHRQQQATIALMRAWIEKLKAQTLLEDAAFSQAEMEEDELYERQLAELKKKAMELGDEGERQEVLRELERMEVEEEREEERLLKEIEERVMRRREVRLGGGGAGVGERREVM